MHEEEALAATRVLELLTRARQPLAAPWSACEEISGGFIGEVETRPLSCEAVPRAAWNGYAVVAGIRRDDELEVLGTLTPERVLDADGLAAAYPAAPPAAGVAERARVWRVESGAPLPRGTLAVLAVADSTVVGSRQVRVDRVPPPGSGILAPRALPPLAAGTHLGPRLRAALDVWGLSRARVVPPFGVGILAVGDELVDLDGSSPLALAGAATAERTAAWLPEAVRALGLRAVPLGIAGDDPERLRELLLQAVFRQLAVVVLAGGIGDGLTDRTREGIERFGATIRVARLALDGCERFLHARGEGLDVFALSGHPLDAACAYDLFVRPALAARLGADRALWDWTRRRWPLEAPVPCAAARDVVRPAAFVERSDGSACVRLLLMEPRALPRLPAQTGWAVLRAPPAASAPANGVEHCSAHVVHLAVE